MRLLTGNLLRLWTAVNPCDWEKSKIMMMQEQCIRFYGNVKDCYIARFLLQNSCSYIPYVKGLFTSTNEQVAMWSSLMLLASKRKDICASPQSLFHFHTIQFLVMEFHVMLSFFFFFFFGWSLQSSSVFWRVKCTSLMITLKMKGEYLVLTISLGVTNKIYRCCCSRSKTSAYFNKEVTRT